MTRTKKTIVALIVAVVLATMGFIADLLGISADPRVEWLLKNAQNPFIIVTLIFSIGCNGIFLLCIFKQRKMRRDDIESLLNVAYADPRYTISSYKRIYEIEDNGDVKGYYEYDLQIMNSLREYDYSTSNMYVKFKGIEHDKAAQKAAVEEITNSLTGAAIKGYSWAFEPNGIDYLKIQLCGLGWNHNQTRISFKTRLPHYFQIGQPENRENVHMALRTKVSQIVFRLGPSSTLKIVPVNTVEIDAEGDESVHSTDKYFMQNGIDTIWRIEEPTWQHHYNIRFFLRNK